MFVLWKRFCSLGRHQWRCKQKINDPNLNANSENPTSYEIHVEPVISSPTTDLTKKSGVKCCCGKVCKGARGLKAHQRSCRVILRLNEELLEHVIEQEQSSNDCRSDLNEIGNDTTFIDNQDDEYPELKKGINLPKTDSEWLTANEYFKFALAPDPPITSHDLNLSIKHLNETMYTYFANNFGFVESLPDNTLVDKYKNHGIKELKKALKLL